MRETVYCPSCKQTVWKDDVNSCWDEKARANDQAVRDAEQLVLDRAVGFVEMLKYYDDTLSRYGENVAKQFQEQITKGAEDNLRTAVADLFAAEAAA